MAIPFFIIFALLSTSVCALDDEDEIENLNRQFRRFFDTKKYDQAENFAKHALQKVEARRGESHLDVAAMLDNLALVYEWQGKFTDAQQLSERSLALRTKLLGEENLDVALKLNDVASLQITHGQYQQAEPLLQRTLAITEKIFGPNHPSVAMSLNNIAVLHHRQGYYQKVEPLIRRALKIRENAFSTDHPDLPASFNNLGALHDVEGRHSEAKMQYQRALVMLEKVSGKDGPALTTVLNNLSRLNLILGNLSEAESFIQRSLSILQKTYGEDHLVVAYALNRLGELRRSQGDYGQSESAFTRSLEIMDKTFGSNNEHPDRVGIVRNLVSLYRTTGREQEVARLVNRVGGGTDLAVPSHDELLRPMLKLTGDTWYLPEPIDQVAPIYPEVLRRSGTKGTVIVSVLITKEGMVQDHILIESGHPALEKAVVEAVLKWQVKPPRTLSGKNVSGRMAQPFNFRLDEAGGGNPAFGLPKNTEGLPPEFQYDVPPIIKVVAPVVYPVDLLRKNIGGSARVSVTIDPKGEVREVEILDATHPEFGVATRAMMQSWIFQPATKNGKPTWAAFSKNQKFDRDNRDINIGGVTETLLRKKEDDPDIHSLSELDALPEPVYAPQPVYPYHLKVSGVTDLVLVEFLIDEDGWVHLPRLIEGKNEELGWLALTAVLRWRFTPPLQSGKPVVARVRMPVRFQLE
ncbi:TonB family protein [Nitrosospira sp. Is2]|uniref:TonB family protein n=1 Tax=Nitrosospira sp. Is2 TaxID=3080532 RepID=UPI002952E22C|nr:TonB family protein [Nitrosospira sp. Is2]WON72907.1 TonB family protein [Nitrosospira sp. Is2]